MTTTVEATNNTTTANAETEYQTNFWAGIESAEPDAGRAKVSNIVVPEAIRTLIVDQVIPAGRKDIITEGWNDEKLKSFKRLAKAAGGNAGKTLRFMATTNAGRAALRISVMLTADEKVAEKALKDAAKAAKKAAADKAKADADKAKADADKAKPADTTTAGKPKK